VFDLAHKRTTGDLVAIADTLGATHERMIATQNTAVTGTPTGLIQLDTATAGFQPGNLVILAARPSMGKSALAITAAHHVAKNTGKPVAIFSLEMSDTEVNQRLLSLESGVPLRRIRQSELLEPDDWTAVTRGFNTLSQMPIHVDDSGDLRIMELRSRARRLKARQPDLALVVVDYLQLMGSDQRIDNRVQEVSQISRGLKVLARDLDVPVLALSQLSRAVESRSDKRPILSDLRESGIDRTGRRPRHLRLPRRRLQTRAHRRRQDQGRADHGEAPQRPHRHRRRPLAGQPGDVQGRGMSDHGWIVIPGWEEFQHRDAARSQVPTWVKTYTKLLSDDDFLDLSHHLRGVLLGLWLEYARSHAALSGNTTSLSRRLGQRVTDKNLEALNHAGFIDFSASKPASNPAGEPASLEKRREEPPHPHSGKGFPRANGRSPRQTRTNPRAEPPATFTCGIGTCPGVYTTQTKLDQHRELAHITAATSPADHRPDWAYPPSIEESA
jgi:replicative DNA helicase